MFTSRGVCAVLLCFTPGLESSAGGLAACWEREYLWNLEHLQEIFYNACNTVLGWANSAMPASHSPLLTVQQVATLQASVFGGEWGWWGRAEVEASTLQ